MIKEDICFIFILLIMLVVSFVSGYAAYGSENLQIEASITTHSAGTIEFNVARKGEYPPDIQIKIEDGKIVEIHDHMQATYQVKDETDDQGNRTITVNY